MAVLAAILLSIACVSASATNNVADLTVSYRYCPVHYYKITYDDGPWYWLVIEPASDKTSLAFMRWSDPDADDVLNELSVTKKLGTEMQVGLIQDTWDKSSHDSTSLMLDWSNSRFGIGAIAPLHSHTDDKTNLSCRVNLGEQFTAYLTLPTSGDDPELYGLGFYPEGACLDLAYGGRTWFFRASKGIDKYRPELRLKFTRKENFIGIGIGYCPD